MPLGYLLDEHLRGVLWKAIQQHNGSGADLLDAVCVGDPSDLPLGTTDPDILLWAERHGRILVSLDKKTLPGHLAHHLRAGHHSPGVFIVRRRCTLPQVISYLVIVSHTSVQAAWQDRIAYIP